MINDGVITGSSVPGTVLPVLDDIIVTELLHQRPSRRPDHAAENHALVALAQAMAESPRTLLQKLVDEALRLTGADSAGVSVLEDDGPDAVFRWRATAGEFFPFAQTTIPGHFSPCSVVLARNVTLLMSEPVRYYPYIADLKPHVAELLLVPFHRGATPIGTVWVVAHTHKKQFDAEDARLAASLASFASAAVQVVSDMEASEAKSRLLQAEVAERQKAENALRSGQARFHQLADAMPQMVWVTRPDGYHEFYNERWYAFTGVSEGSTDGDGWNRMFHPDDQERAWAVWRRSLATGESYEVEYRLRHHTGEYRWTLGRALPVRNERGEIDRWYGTCTDIHALKLLMDERERLLQSERSARSEAETANRAKDRFLAVLSHELRTPLTPVAMAATAMEMDSGLPCEFREDMAMIRRNIDLETRLIDDLLDLSRVMSGKLQLNQQPTDVHRLIGYVLETVGPELHEKHLKVERHFVATNDRVEADPARLQQTLWNLLKNSAKFTPSGGLVFLRTRNEANQLLIDVGDTGKGIAADVLPRIFDPFEQGAADVTRRYGGMGLGLAIAKALVDLHGGTIRAASEGEGKGAVFTVSLPLISVDASGEVPVPAGEPAIGGDCPVRVLLVEDHADTAKMLVRLLRLDGLEVHWAGSMGAALELAASEPFDVVVSDLGLPDGSGNDLMRQLSQDSHVVGIAMSGNGMEDDIRQSRDSGFVEHLVKPVSMLQLRDAIRRAARVSNG